LTAIIKAMRRIRAARSSQTSAAEIGLLAG
jgi:hypothetical protein